uniref:Uncharacterized protein n=1 Tax=Thermosporothrix sp. COM3 TaxID=2490863 RepID=A0A455T047_9CHLR|nr:hypothetical protein KTC_65160 [Thermosporothrix sp. COM3]
MHTLYERLHTQIQQEHAFWQSRLRRPLASTWLAFFFGSIIGDHRTETVIHAYRERCLRQQNTPSAAVRELTRKLHQTERLLHRIQQQPLQESKQLRQARSEAFELTRHLNAVERQMQTIRLKLVELRIRQS